MYCCWILLDHDPGSTQRRVGTLRMLNSARLSFFDFGSVRY
jgi:hypothetical protein